MSKKFIKNNKKSQNQKVSKRDFSLLSSKAGQDEMVGFGLIIIVVAVILLVFVGSMINKNKENKIENYEVNAFVQSMLQYTTACKIDSEYPNIHDLIFACADNKPCENLRNYDSCDVLKSTIEEILSKSWTVGEEGYLKGYRFSIVTDSKEIIGPLNKGNIDTKNYRDIPVTEFTKKGATAEVYFTAYY